MTIVEYIAVCDSRGFDGRAEADKVFGVEAVDRALAGDVIPADIPAPLVDFTGNREDLLKTKTCSICGGTYNQVSMTWVKGRWYCLVNECAEEASQR